jgi:hypothetical protein
MSSSEQSAVAENDLKKQLHAKDQLVRALTDRLEEAAEQLDRVQRTGGDKGGRGGGSSEAALSGHPLFEKLSKSLELWEDVQPADAFARIEERLEELRDMLEGAIVGTTGEAPAPKKKDVLSGWEKMKAELMGEAEPSAPAAGGTKSHEVSPAAKQQASPASDESSEEPSPAAPAARPVPVEPPRPLEELTLPEPVDLEGASRPELVDAIEIRDQYIGELTRRLRSAESRTHQPIDWAALDNAPDDLREALQKLESELTDRLRIAEVDLSLERARLSRVETRIRATQMQIEKKLQQSVGTDAGNGKASVAKKAESQGKGWFGGRGR